MKVIIKKTNEVKEVSTGYAVNYLIPQGLAQIATASRIELLKRSQESKIKSQKLEVKENKILAANLWNKKVTIKRSGIKKGDLYEGVKERDIVDILGVKPGKVKVLLDKPIKKAGKYKVGLQIGDEIVKIELAVVLK